MSAPYSADTPKFNLVQFEAEAIGRGAELIAHVARLAILKTDNPSSWTRCTEAQYYLDDNSRLELKYEESVRNSKNKVAKARLSQPPVEITGIDGQLRRVTVTRSILHCNFDDTYGSLNGDLEQELPPASPRLEKLNALYMKQVKQAQFEDRMDPNYRPGELILAGTSTLIECKLPKSPNFRTEHVRTLTGATKLAHIAARRRAGEAVVDMPYDIPEHKALMIRLSEIEPDMADPQPLDSDFDDSWRDPEPTLRFWIPSN